jgi:hypothetical protein
MSEQKAMTSFEKASLILTLFAAWGVIFFGVWTVYILSDFYKILIDVVWSIGFLIASVSYFKWDKVNPKLQSSVLLIKATNFKLIIFAAFIGLAIIEGILSIYLSLTTWTIFEVSGVPVFTYGNLLSSTLLVFGIYIISYSGRRISEFRKERKKRKRKEKKLASFNQKSV